MKKILSSAIFMVLIICSYAANLKQYNNPWVLDTSTKSLVGIQYYVKNRTTGKEITDKKWCESWEGKKWGNEPYKCEMHKSMFRASKSCICKKVPLSPETCLPSPKTCQECCAGAMSFTDFECCIYHEKMPCNKLTSRIKWQWVAQKDTGAKGKCTYQ
jgi:hypothetical protein